MTPATSFVSKPSSFPTPWSSWTMKSPLRRSAKEASARPRRLSARGGRLRKTCVSGRRTRPSSRQTKPRRAGATANRSSGCSGRSSPASSSRESARLSRLSVRSASPACGNATTTRLPPLTKPFSSFSASARPRAAIAGRCASNENGCACGNGSSSEAPLSEISLETLPRPRPASPRPAARRSPGARSSTCTRSRGISGLYVSWSSSRSVGSVRSARRSIGGIDHGAVDRMQRPLGEGRERAHLLDLVAVELDPERLAARGREDVDEPTADSELAALLGTLDALVARERELLGEARRGRARLRPRAGPAPAAPQPAASPRRARSRTRRRGRRPRARRGRAHARRRDAAAARGRSPSGRRARAAARRARRR